MSALGAAGQSLAFAEIEGLLVGGAHWVSLRRWSSRSVVWVIVVIGAQFARLIVGHLQVYPPVATLLGWINAALVMGLGMAYLLPERWRRNSAAGNDPADLPGPTA